MEEKKSGEKYQVKTAEFEGPLDLLLHLIEKRKLHINDISLSQVTDDFIGYVGQKEGFPTGEIAQFIAVAATLLLIKSRTLLPMLQLSDEEEENIDDLEQRLKEYQRFKELSRHVKERFGKEIIWGREGRTIEPIFSPNAEISIESIAVAARMVIAAFPKPENLPKTIVKKVISLEEMIERLLKRITEGFKMSFREFSKAGDKSAARENIIVSFLAVLELIKRGMVQAEQRGDFGEIEIEVVNKKISRG